MKIIAKKSGNHILLSSKENEYIQKKIASKLGKSGPFKINGIRIAQMSEYSVTLDKISRLMGDAENVEEAYFEKDQDGLIELVVRGTYGDSSVLESEDFRKVIDAFDSLEEAKLKYPGVEFRDGFESSVPTEDMLPDSDRYDEPYA